MTLRRTKSQRPCARLRTEALESRALLAADFGFAFALATPSNSDRAGPIALDPSGDIYIACHLGGFLDPAQVDFDPGPGQTVVTAFPPTSDFIARYHPDGSLVWVQAVSGTPESMAVDAGGNLLVAGFFSGDLDFDPGPAEYRLRSALRSTGSFSQDIFIAKFGGSGEFVWAAGFGAAGTDVVTSITVDAQGNSYATGAYCNAVDFDPGPGTTILNGTSDVDENAFVLKLTPAGTLGWARQLGTNAIWHERGKAVALDSQGNVLITGEFNGLSDFDPDPVGVYQLGTTDNSSPDMFVEKLTAGGSFVWVKQVANSGRLFSNALALGGSDEIYVAGTFSGSPDFDPSNSTFNLTSKGQFFDAYILRMNTIGAFEWARQLGGTNSGKTTMSSLAVDGDGHIFATGGRESTVEFTPSPTTFSLQGTQDIYVLEINTDGTFVTAAAMGGAGHNDDQGQGIVVDSAGNLYTTGYFDTVLVPSVADFDPGPGIYNIPSIGGDDVFVSKLTNFPSAPPSLSTQNVTVLEGASGTVPVVIPVNLSAPTNQTVTVQFETVGGTAVASEDFEALSGVLTFAPGVTTQNVTVLIKSDELDEVDETFVLRFFNQNNATFPLDQATVTITDDDAPPAIWIDNLRVIEGNSGTTNAAIVVRLSAPSGKTVTVEYSMADGTATAEDYTAQSGTATLNPGQVSKSINFSVYGDTQDETDEVLYVNLQNVVNATLVHALGVATIQNDEVLISIGDASFSEADSGSGEIQFFVTLSAAASYPITVAYSTLTQSAGASDFVPETGFVTFQPGVTSLPVGITINDDSLVEGSETFRVDLSQPVNTTLSDSSGVGTITDDEPAAIFSIADISLIEGPTGVNASAVFTISLSIPAANTARVRAQTSNGSAVSPNDFTATSLFVQFAAGVTSRTFTVPIKGDNIIEGNEAFTVTLSSPTVGVIGDGVGVATIVDDDATVARDDAFECDEDAYLVVARDAGVLANDTTSRQTPLEAVVAAAPVHGTLTLNADGSFQYLPEINFNGIDSFTYRANPGQETSNLATVTLTIRAIDDVLGDMNGDGTLNNFDIQDFELALTDGSTYLIAHPNRQDFSSRGDVNQDGVFNNFDIQPFENALTSSATNNSLAAASASTDLAFDSHVFVTYSASVSPDYSANSASLAGTESADQSRMPLGEHSSEPTPSISEAFSWLRRHQLPLTQQSALLMHQAIKRFRL